MSRKVRARATIAASNGSQILILMKMAESGGVISVVMCGIDDKKDNHSMATTNEDEKGRQPDETDRDSTIQPTNEHNPSETEKHAGGKK
ncbi:MAG: hypothetical protein Q9185_001346 [Variospora sp. 1 TL-2023]